MTHSIVVYFADWHLGAPGARHHGEAAGLPWAKVTHINHAFWYIEPVEEPAVSTFARRASGKGARTDFRIVPLSPEKDLLDSAESALVPGLARNHFAQYAYFAKLYPQVRIMLSIGGWTKSGFFSEMAFTREGRHSFIACCLELMERYPWIGGIDIDWEYPAGSGGIERRPDAADPEDQGCPIFGTAQQDLANFAAMLRELREAMTRKYGEGVKQLTACSSGAVSGALDRQDWAAAAPYLDLLNIMSYDLAGVWDGIANHTSSAAQAMAAVQYLRSLGIPGRKLCIGSPLYGSPFRLKEPADLPLGKAADTSRPIATELLDQAQLMRWEAEADQGIGGWHKVFDAENGGAYLYNNGGGDRDRWFLSYENTLSLQKKLDDILENGLAGIIVWEAGQDTEDADRITQMYNALNTTNKVG